MGMTVQELLKKLQEANKTLPVKGIVQFDHSDCYGKDVIHVEVSDDEVLIVLKGRLR